jgi:hypothetical protein
MFGGKKSWRRTVPNAIDGGIREDSLLMEVGPVTRLLNQRGWEAMSIGLVVGQLIVHEIIDLQTSIFSGTVILRCTLSVR